jgi:DNA-directed RNA polymerase beta subunit
VRTSFAKLDQQLALPHLIDIQKVSWEWFLKEGLRETIADINPIKDYSEKLLVEFGDYAFGEPSKPIAECRNKDMTYSAPLTMEVRFINEETGEIREQRVFMGDFPMMTERGTFIIHGTERVVVTQLVRSPGAYIMEPKQAEREKRCSSPTSCRSGAPGSSSRSTRRAPSTSASTASASSPSPYCCGRWATAPTMSLSRSSTIRSTSATPSSATPPARKKRR